MPALLLPLTAPWVYWLAGLAVIRPVGDLRYVGWIVLLGMSVVAFGVAFHLLRQRAGAPRNPDEELAHLIGGTLYWKQLAVWLVAGVFYTALIDLVGPWPAAILGAPMLLALPAATMVLAIDGSVISAVNPAMLFALIKRLGGDYWRTCGWVLLLYALVYASERWLGHQGVGGRVLHAAIAVWALFAMFVLFGDLLRRNAEQLWHPPRSQAPPGEIDQRVTGIPESPVDRPVDAATDPPGLDSDWRARLAALESSLRERPADVELQRERWALVQRKADATELVRVAAEAVPLALEAGDSLLAVQAAVQALDLDPEFVPGRPLMVFALIRHARDQRLTQAARRLARWFLARHPEHERRGTVTLWLADTYGAGEPLDEELRRSLRALRDSDAPSDQRAEADLALRMRDIT